MNEPAGFILTEALAAKQISDTLDDPRLGQSFFGLIDANISLRHGYPRIAFCLAPRATRPAKWLRGLRLFHSRASTL